MMLFLKALLSLLISDLYLMRGNFAVLHQRVRSCPLGAKQAGSETTARVCAAFELASIWYPRHSLCLQRSSALTCLLRAYGVQARMIIGAQRLPFRAHAWVEVNGEVVNDRPYMREMYRVLETC
jgi:Transglutaminase-like superfamily